MSSGREKRLEAILARFLKPVKGIPFEIVIKSLCGTNVDRFDTEVPQSKVILGKIVAAMRDACLAVIAKPIMRPRPNEVGNDMEAFAIQALQRHGLKAAGPKTLGGKGKSSGCPDIRIETTGNPVYLEVKSCAASPFKSSFRSFYLSPAEDAKVSQDGHHLLVGFAMRRTDNSFVPEGFKLVDLYGLDCDMKAGFNSDNRRLSTADRVLANWTIGISLGFRPASQRLSPRGRRQGEVARVDVL